MLTSLTRAKIARWMAFGWVMLGAAVGPNSTVYGQGSEGAATTQSQAKPVNSVERGRYLVHHVAMCVQCHSPRDERGNLISEELLRGGQLPVKSPFSGSVWAFRAPNLAGLPGWTKQGLVQLLTSGRSPSGTRPKSPMPGYRMSRADAQAVADYLASLASARGYAQRASAPSAQ